MREDNYDDEKTDEVFSQMHDTRRWGPLLEEFYSISNPETPSQPHNIQEHGPSEDEGSITKPQDENHREPKGDFITKFERIILHEGPCDTSCDPEDTAYVPKDMIDPSQDIPHPKPKLSIEHTRFEREILNFYSKMAGDFAIPPPSILSYTGDTIPIHRREWECEDGPDELDLMYALQSSGMVIPGENAFKWLYEQDENGNIEERELDLCICLDSSGSMPDPSKEISVPVICATSLAHSAINQGRKVGVINYSSRSKVLDYTDSSRDIEKALLSYIGEGTRLPLRDIESMIETKDQYMVIISDTKINGLASEIGYLEDAYKRCAGGSVFLFGARNKNTEIIEEIGFNVYNSSTMDDLVRMSSELAGDLYG